MELLASMMDEYVEAEEQHIHILVPTDEGAKE